MKSKSADTERLDRLERKENRLEREIKKLEKEEKALEKKLKKLTIKEMKLAKTVSELEHVKKRRPKFLINYTESKDTGGIVAELKSSSRVEMEVNEERKQLLRANIKKVLKRQELVKKETKEREEKLGSKTPIKELKINNKAHDTIRLFRVLLAKGTITMDEASEQLNVGKDTIEKWTMDLENSGIIEVSTPLYGSPILKLKTLTTGLKKKLTR